MPDDPRFQTYAADFAAKLNPGARDGLVRRRQRMWTRAFRPLEGRLRSAGAILDHGCGEGEFLDWLATRTSASLAGFEVAPDQLKLAKLRCAARSQVTFLERDDPPEPRYDLVFSHHVVEHIRDDALPGFIARLTGHVRPGGALVMATPNGLNPFAHAFFMSADPTHTRMHSPYSLAQVFRAAGFAIRSVHRELPQAYDVPSWFKTAAWAVLAAGCRVAAAASGAGVRGLGFPLIMAGSFYIVATAESAGGGTPTTPSG